MHGPHVSVVPSAGPAGGGQTDAGVYAQRFRGDPAFDERAGDRVCPVCDLTGHDHIVFRTAFWQLNRREGREYGATAYLDHGHGHFSFDDDIGGTDDTGGEIQKICPAGHGTDTDLDDQYACDADFWSGGKCTPEFCTGEFKIIIVGSSGGPAAFH